jgi:hypothetical protein
VICLDKQIAKAYTTNIHHSKRGVIVEAKTLLVADYANVAEGGKPNVMGIFRDIYSPTFPVRHPEMFLVVILQASVAEKGQKRNIIIKLMNPDASQILVNYSQVFDVPDAPPGRKPEINIILRMRDLIFEKPGPYSFSVLVDNDEKATYPIELHETKAN